MKPVVQAICVLLLLWSALVLTKLSMDSTKSIDRALRHPRYEYMLGNLRDNEFSSSVNALGAQGWDIVSYRRVVDDTQQPPLWMNETLLRRVIDPDAR